MKKKSELFVLILGHSNTSISIFENNKFIYGDSFLVGSNNITNDLARGVSTTLESAETIKNTYIVRLLVHQVMSLKLLKFQLFLGKVE